MSRNWRNWKTSLKKNYYNPYHTIRERLQHCLARGNPDQWALLVTFWGSQEGVVRSRRNSRNREARTMNHMAGTKSFARICEEVVISYLISWQMFVPLSLVARIKDLSCVLESVGSHQLHHLVVSLLMLNVLFLV